jgi:hypothetical protein
MAPIDTRCSQVLRGNEHRRIGTRDLRPARPAPLLDVTRPAATGSIYSTSFDSNAHESTGPLAPRWQAFSMLTTEQYQTTCKRRFL